jgi:hypothetical protein
MSQNQNKNHQIKTDDLAFSAFLKMRGFQLIKSDKKTSKRIFTFEIDPESNSDTLKIDFINSDFITYYNELRNLKKLL